MSGMAHNVRQPRTYTVNDSRADIEYLGQRFDTLEAERTRQMRLEM